MPRNAITFVLALGLTLAHIETVHAVEGSSVGASVGIETVVQDKLKTAKKVGQGRYSFLSWDVYDAVLYAPEGQFNPKQPFVLALTYFRSFEGQDIADRSVQEIRGQGFSDEVTLATWHSQMKAIFPDVTDGTTLWAVFTPDVETTFYKGNQPLGTIKGGGFVNAFSGIWLSPKTSDPDLRKSLLRQKTN